MLFALRNACMLKLDFRQALKYSRERTSLIKDLFKKTHKDYAEALFLEVSCMRYLKDFNHQAALSMITEALQIMLRLDKGKMSDGHLARIYEEKGHILRLMAIKQSDSADLNLRALQCFSSASQISRRSGDTTRLELIE